MAVAGGHTHREADVPVAFHIGSDDGGHFRPKLQATDARGFSYKNKIKKSLGILDGLDRNCGNQLYAGDDGDRYEGLAGVLVDDQLYVNTESGICGTYLGLEGEVTGALTAGAGGCGGRTPNDDIIDRTYSVLAAGLLTGVDDTITEDDAVHSTTTFPFLADPQ